MPIDTTALAPLTDLLNRAAALLEQRAEQATQGEEQDLYDDPGWTADEDPGCAEPGDLVLPVVRTCDGEIVASCPSRADADLIAAMSPHAVAELAPALRDMAKALEVDEQVRLNNPGEPFRPRVMFGLAGMAAFAAALLREWPADG